MGRFQVPVFCWSCGQDFEGVGRAECPRCKPPEKPVPMVFYWMGRRVESLSHAELVEAVKELGRDNQALLEDNMRRVQRDAEMFRKLRRNP